MSEYVDVYFDFRDVSPDEFYGDLCTLHDEIHIEDLTPLLDMLEEENEFELCPVVLEFAKDWKIECRGL